MKGSMYVVLAMMAAIVTNVFAAGHLVVENAWIRNAPAGAGMMAGYKQFFGTPDQPNKPARSTVQVAGLAAPGPSMEIEVTAARPPK